MARIARALDTDGARVDGIRQYGADQGFSGVRDQTLELGFQTTNPRWNRPASLLDVDGVDIERVAHAPRLRQATDQWQPLIEQAMQGTALAALEQ